MALNMHAQLRKRSQVLIVMGNLFFHGHRSWNQGASWEWRLILHKVARQLGALHTSHLPEEQAKLLCNFIQRLRFLPVP